MPVINRRGKVVYADDQALKSLSLEAVRGNIVIIRQPEGNFMFPAGFTLVYFMDSDASAQAMKEGKLAYKLVPDRARFSFDSSPITDVWKGRADKENKAILGMVQGFSNEQEIYVDKMTIRPGYKRASIMRKLVDALQAHFPDAKVNFSGPTKEGDKFIRGYTGAEWKPAHGEQKEF